MAYDDDDNQPSHHHDNCFYHTVIIIHLVNMNMVGLWMKQQKEIQRKAQKISWTLHTLG
jgi:hypothetical protein